MNASGFYSAFSNLSTKRQFALVFIFILIAFWQITSFQYTLKWDAIDLTLPWRYFTSDALRNGILPWWNPFQRLGFVHGSMPETWYPIALLLDMIRPYDAISLNLEYLIHIFIASTGFFHLARAFGIQHQSALWGALCFPLSGFFVGNAQHMGWIVAGAWMPHVFAYYVRFLRTSRWLFGLYATISFFLLATGGYVPFVVVTTFILFGLSIRHVYVKKFSVDSFIRLAKWATLCFLLCCLVLICYLELQSHITRSEAVDASDTLLGTLRLKHLISFILPYMTVKGGYAYWQGDQSMMNLYIGLLPLIVAVLSLKNIRSHFYSYLWLGAGISISLTLAAELPFRMWLNLIPPFDQFRFPSLFRYFTILSLLLLATSYIEKWTKDVVKYLPTISLVLAILCSGFALASWLFFPQFNLAGISVKTPLQALVVQSHFHALILWLTFIVIRKTAPNHVITVLLLISFLDLTVSTQLNGSVSIFSEKKLQEVQATVHAASRGYPNNSLTDPVGSNIDKGLYHIPVYRNTNTFYKRSGDDAYSPYQYHLHEQLEQSDYYLKSLAQPIIYLSQLIATNDTMRHYTSVPEVTSRENQINIQEYSPNHAVLKTSTAVPKILVYNQIYHENWYAYVEGKALERVCVDGSLLGFWLPEGEHSVTLQFEPGHLFHALIISFGAFLLIIFAIIMLEWGGMHRAVRIAVIVVPILITAAYLLRNSSQTELVLLDDTDIHLVNAIDDLTLSNQEKGDTILVHRFLDRADLSGFRECISALEEQSFVFYSRPIPTPSGHLFTDFLSANYAVDTLSLDKGYFAYRCNSRSLAPYFFNGFDLETSRWTIIESAMEIETSGNRFENISDIKYSSTFERPWDKTFASTSAVDITLEVKTESPSNAKLVFSIVDDGSEIVHHFKPLPDTKNAWQKIQWSIPSSEELLPKSSTLKIYIWNPALEAIAVDNYLISPRQ